MKLSLGEVIAIVVAVAAWAAVYYQARSVRIAEEQFRTQVKSLEDIVYRIEREREERQAAITDFMKSTKALKADLRGGKVQSSLFTQSSTIFMAKLVSRIGFGLAAAARVLIKETDGRENDIGRLLVAINRMAVFQSDCARTLDARMNYLTDQSLGRAAEPPKPDFPEALANADHEFQLFLDALDVFSKDHSQVDQSGTMNEAPNDESAEAHDGDPSPSRTE